MILALLFTSLFSPQGLQQAQAGQDSACAARHFVCLRECTKDMQRSQKQCEEEDQCGPLSQCDTGTRPARADMTDISPGLAKCDETLGKETQACEGKEGVEGLRCLQGTLKNYRACVKALSSGRPKPANRARR